MHNLNEFSHSEFVIFNVVENKIKLIVTIKYIWRHLITYTRDRV